MSFFASDDIDGNDRYGCGRIALTLLAILSLLMLLSAGWYALDPNMRQTVDQFINAFGGGGPGQNNANPGNQPNGPGGASQGPSSPSVPPQSVIPPISDRFFGGGSAQAGVTGAFSLTTSMTIDTIRSYADDGLGWIGFESADGEILVALNEPENSVTIAQGDLVAIGADDACSFQIQVTPTLVSGHIACPSVDVYQGEKVTGQATIELDFTASS